MPAPKNGDIVYTPAWVAADMVRYFQPRGTILEPCCGDGAFLRWLPPGTHWCEITRGRDFFGWDRQVRWIVTNPPYSQLAAFLRQALKVADNVVFLVPAGFFFLSYNRVHAPREYGAALAAIRWYGGGTKLGFPMGNPIAALHWKRGHEGTITETFYEDHIRLVWARLRRCTKDYQRPYHRTGDRYSAPRRYQTSWGEMSGIRAVTH